MKWKPVVNSKFIRLYEIVLLVIFFSVMLVVIFPKGRLEKYIKEEKNVNPQLAIIYIEALEKIKPNSDIRVIKALAYVNMGKFEEAYKAVEGLLNNSLDENSLVQLYLILKRLYFATHKEEEKAQIYKDMEKALGSLSNTSDLKRLEWLYQEAVSMAFHEMALDTLVRINIITKNRDVFWLEKAYKHSLELKKYNLAVRYLDYLLAADKEREALWLKEYYKLALAMDDPNLALEVLVGLYNLDVPEREKIKKDIAWLLLKTNRDPEVFFKRYIEEHPAKAGEYLEIIANAYKAKRNFYRAYQVYSNLYNRTQNLREKDRLYKEILSLLLEAKDYNNLKTFIRDNYTNHLHNTELMKLTLKASLATGDPDFAYSISKQIARRVE